MIDSHKYISTQIENEIPQFIRMEYPNFVAFIKAYYEWMEKQGAPYHFIANALNYSDVDRTSLQLLDEFGKNFLNPLPNIIYNQNNIATLVKNIEQYYSARGSEKAFQFLFRLFQYQGDKDHDLEFYYPSYDMLRVSDGKWINEKSIKIIDPPDNVMSWEAGQVTGQESGAIAIIDEVKVYESSSGVKIAELSLIEFNVIHTPEKFICGETIEIITKELNVYKAVTENVLSGIKITNSGKFYIPDQRVQVINNGIGEDARVVIDTINKGSVSGFTIIDGGINYELNDKVYTDNTGFGYGAYGKVTEVDSNGSITKIKMIFGGHDYQYCQSVLVDSVNGEHAVIMMDSDDIGSITNVEIRDFGINYISSETTLLFNTTMRIYNDERDWFVGEEIIGETSGAIGIIEYYNKKSGVMSIRVKSGTFGVGEKIIGQRYGGTAIIYETSTATGVVEDGCLCKYKGRYLNMDGHISSLKYIQDSYFYQMFSYMLKTTRDKSEWGDYINHVHPSGTIGFSYKDITSQIFNESYGGFISPQLDTTEFYKFRWDSEQYHGGHIRYNGNTQIKQYKDILIDDIANINNDIKNKTKFCFGSEVSIS
jgi:hypothetical protein